MYTLGSLEETVMLLAMILGDDAYGVSVAQAYKEKTGQAISIPAIHTVLRRLEEKGFLTSTYSEATPERGGRKKRLYQVTPLGYRVVSDINEQRMRFWSLVPKPDFL